MKSGGFTAHNLTSADPPFKPETLLAYELGVKTDVATTRSDLETTKSQLQRVVGDAGVMSGLIATNHSELEELKHKGDRNYLEFTLQKGAKPTLLNGVAGGAIYH